MYHHTIIKCELNGKDFKLAWLYTLKASLSIDAMVLILEGSSEHVSHVWTWIGNLICLHQRLRINKYSFSVFLLMCARYPELPSITTRFSEHYLEEGFLISLLCIYLTLLHLRVSLMQVASSQSYSPSGHSSSPLSISHDTYVIA